MLVSDLPKVMIISLTLTLVFELGVGLLLKYRGKDLINIFLVNVLTNPLLNSIIVAINYYYGLKVRNISLIILEILVVIIEGFIYQKYLEKRNINGYLLSIILNIASFGLGLIANNIIY